MDDQRRRLAQNTKEGSWGSRELNSATVISFAHNIQDHGSVVHNSGGLKRSRHDVTTIATQAQGEKVTSVVDAREGHLIAERERRAKLAQKFIALSAVLPDLKKMDKASILEDTFKYMKQLQEKVKELEDQANKSRVITSATFVDELSQVQGNEDCTSSCGDNSQNKPFEDDKHPKVEVKIYDNSVHIRIQCENHMEVLAKLLTAIHNLYLTVTNMSVIPFARSFLDITVMAQIGKGLSLEAEELVRDLNSVLRQLK